jgi:hypothetical protein
MNFIIDLFKKAVKGDNFRTAEPPIKYNDKIMQLNSQSPNQYNKLTTNSISKIQKTTSTLTQNTTGGTILPGTV